MEVVAGLLFNLERKDGYGWTCNRVHSVQILTDMKNVRLIYNISISINFAGNRASAAFFVTDGAQEKLPTEPCGIATRISLVWL